MPKFDGTGPAGAGPMTGGGFGYCNPAGMARRPYGGLAPGYGRGFGRGRGFGQGRGFGRGLGPCGWGRGYGWQGSYGPAYAGASATNSEDELRMLRDEASAIKDDLDAINKRIEELEKGSSE